ncbi:TonB system transport protein ExbD [Oligella urethralis]|uniref:TonB system transport protein ExbD n=1 Tax=Oligella urethralis TaxID=90245 RepID=UPI000E07D0B7|nr:TonB system transport protein ExbD [Oligella urethralis]SUA57548.1 Biopolymer transport protein exbD [Oligella urethralis]
MQKFDGINVVPFIDIMLVLLAIVLATATFISQGKIQVNLPQSNNSTSLASQDLAVVVVVDQAGHYFIDDKPQSLSELEALMTQQSDHPITIKVDATAPFQSFLSLTDILNKQNLSKVTVITEKSSTEQH